MNTPNNKCGYPVVSCDCDYPCRGKTNTPTRSPYPNLSSKWKELGTLLSQPSFGYKKVGFKRLLKDLQANIVASNKKKKVTCYKLNFEKHSFIKRVEEIRKIISRLSDGYMVSAFEQLKNDPDKLPAMVNFYLTYEGYQFLGVKENEIPGEVGDAFREGSDFSFEKKLEKEERVHAMLVIACEEEENESVEDILSVFEGFSIGYESNYVFKKKTKRSKRKTKIPIEKTGLFVFKEGMGNPRFFPNQDYKQFNRIDPIKEKECTPLNLVLRSDPGGNRWYSCGSFLSAMKFEQNEEVFNAKVKDLIKKLDLKKWEETKADQEELAKAFMMGRFTDGTPITLHKSKKEKFSNAFDYTEIRGNKGFEEDDLKGARCPMHAHIRKANPRTPGTQDKRIVRRGIVSQSKEGDNPGLFFMSFQRSIEDQLEYIIKEWLHSENLDGQITGQDPITGFNSQFPHRYNINRKKQNNIVYDSDNKEALVTLTHQYHFFAPSLSFLKYLDGGVYQRSLELDNLKKASVKSNKIKHALKENSHTDLEIQRKIFGENAFSKKNGEIKSRGFKKEKWMINKEYLAQQKSKAFKKKKLKIKTALKKIR